MVKVARLSAACRLTDRVQDVGKNLLTAFSNLGAITIDQDQAGFGKLFLSLAAGLMADAVIKNHFLDWLAAGQLVVGGEYEDGSSFI